MLRLRDGNRQVQEYTDEQVFTTVYEQDSFVPVARIVQLASHLEQKRLADIAYETRRFVRIGESDVVINQRIADKSQPILKIYHYHCNHLGTPQELSDEKGDVIWLSYDRAWGGSFDSLYKQQFVDNWAISENELQPFKFQGQSLDVETGLHYNRFRYYDSDVGMFVSRDPIGLIGGDNVFSYAPNPIGWFDPLGLKRCLGLPSLRKTGKTGAGKYDKLNGQGLYVLRDSKGVIKYVGRGDVHARGYKHANDPAKSGLTQQIIFDNNLTKAEAKFLEQKLMGMFGGPKSAHSSTPLLNKDRSYSRTNPNAPIYDVAGDSKCWGNEVLQDALNIIKGF